MSIFRRDSSNRESPLVSTPSPSGRRDSGGERSGAITHIAAGTKVHGEITGTAEVMVDGHVEGRLQLDATVLVGKDGRVEGEIVARSVRIEGRVVGNVHGQERVEVTATGSLKGDVSTADVVITEGAFFEGNVDMSNKAKQAARAATPAPGPAAGGSQKPAPAPAEAASAAAADAQRGKKVGK